MSNYEVLNYEDCFPIKSWTKGVPFNDNAKEQLSHLATMPFIHKWIAVMPDVHLGSGSTIGSVIATDKAIIPAAVGVDIGCLDKDTEFLSPSGWIKMSEYSEQDVMQFDPDTGISNFVEPLHYINLKCDKFYHLKTKYGIDQMLSSDFKRTVAMFVCLVDNGAKDLAREYEIAVSTVARWATGVADPHPGIKLRVLEYIRDVG